MSRKQLYSKRIEVCLTPSQKLEVEKEAVKRDLTINQFIREAICRLIKER